jgi:hypothetical protein
VKSFLKESSENLTPPPPPPTAPEIERSGRPYLGETRERPTEELIGLLTPYTGPLDEEGFRRRVSPFASAEEMARSLIAGRDVEGREVDRVWLALRVLWERWVPDEPSVESLDEGMQRGYDEGGGAASCEIWLETWRDAVRLADRFGVATVEEFDDRVNGTQFLFNWVQDLETELLNAAADDERFARERVRFCEEFFARFPDSGLAETMRRALGDAHFQAGQAATGDRLFRQWLEADPTWGWGWIGWSDAYGVFASRAQGARDYARAAEILEQGLAVPDLRDRRDVLERLADAYQEAGRTDDARRVRRELRDLGKGVRVQTSVEAGTASSAKIGRHDPCPCGSGRKYKKCCGAPSARGPS